LPGQHPGDGSRERDRARARAADRRPDVEPDARDPRRAQKALPLPLDRLSRRGPRARNPAPARPGARRRARRPGRAFRSGAARGRSVQSAGRRRDDRLGARAFGPRPRRPRSRNRRRDARRAAQVPGRHRKDGGRAGPGDAACRGGRSAGRTMTSKLAENVVHFTRLLRGVGFPLGPASALDALAATSAVDLFHRPELYWALHASLVRRPEDSDLFDQAFRLFWREPRNEEVLAQLLAQLKMPRSTVAPVVSRRVAEAWRKPTSAPAPPERIEFDAALAFSSDEVL